MEDPKIKTMRDRIAKLMNMTEANGCTEDEAASAMSMAAGLAAKLGIDLDACKPAGAPKTKIVGKKEHQEIKVHVAFCAEAAAILYGCEFECENLGKYGYSFLGREENVELAQMTMMWLVRQVELLYKQHLPRGLTQKARAEFRASFKQACADRVLQRAKELVRQMRTNDQAAQSSTGSNALVVANHYQTLKDEIQDYWHEKWGIGKYAPVKTPEEIQAESDRMAAYLNRLREERAALEAKYESGELKRPREKKVRYREYREPRGRSMKLGNGTNAGRSAGDAVKLRKELD